MIFGGIGCFRRGRFAWKENVDKSLMDRELKKGYENYPRRR
jgi:hypothetical protein